MKVKVDSDKGSLRLRFTYGGKQQTIYLGLSDTKDNRKYAQILANDLVKQALFGELDLIAFKKRLKGDPEKLQKTLPLDQLYDQWLTTVDVSKRYLESVLITVKKHLVNSNGKCFEIPQKWSNETFNDYLRVAKRFYQWSVDQGYLETNPLKKIKQKPKTHSKTRKPFTREEIKLILENIKTCYRDYFLFSVLTGCRPSEIIGLQRKHINFEKKEITIEQSLPRGSKNQRILKSTKSGNIRYLPINQDLFLILEKYQDLPSNEFIFRSETGKTFSDSTFLRYWKKLLTKLGIDYRVPYSLRHTMISHSIEQGLPLTGIAYLVGHSNTQMIQERYGQMINRPDLPGL